MARCAAPALQAGDRVGANQRKHGTCRLKMNRSQSCGVRRHPTLSTQVSENKRLPAEFGGKSPALKAGDASKPLQTKALQGDPKAGKRQSRKPPVFNYLRFKGLRAFVLKLVETC